LSLVAFDLQAASIHSIDQAGMAYFYLEGETLPPRLSTFFSSFGVVLAFGKSRGSVLVKNLIRVGVGKVMEVPSFPPEDAQIHVSEYLVESLRKTGIEGENLFSPLGLPEDVLTSARHFWAAHGLREGKRVLAIHPGSGSPAKNWSPQNFAKVADWASERSKVLLISGPAQDGVAEVMGSMKKASPLVADNLPLIHMAAVLKMSSAYLGNDSGVTHLAASLGLPTVAIFGPTNPAIWGPRGPGVRIIHGKDLSSLFSAEGKSESSLHGLETIKPEEVIQVLSPFLK
jgi:ADP-heptose:LPS heptosyltransferase